MLSYVTCKCFVGIADLSIFEYIMLFFKFISANYKKEDSILSSTVILIDSVVQNINFIVNIEKKEKNLSANQTIVYTKLQRM